MKWIISMLAITLSLSATQAFSRDTKHLYSINDALNSAALKEKLDPAIKLYFANQPHPRVIKG